MAVEAVARLFAVLPPLDVGDARAFLAAAAALFASYPQDIWDGVIDPVRGVPSRWSRPTLANLKEALSDAYEPMARQRAWDSAKLIHASEEEREQERLARSIASADRRRAQQQADLAERRAKYPNLIFGLTLRAGS